MKRAGSSKTSAKANKPKVVSASVYNKALDLGLSLYAAGQSLGNFYAALYLGGGLITYIGIILVIEGFTLPNWLELILRLLACLQWVAWGFFGGYLARRSYRKRKQEIEHLYMKEDDD